MFKLKVTNEVTNQIFTGVFNTLEELNIWKDKEITKSTWGKPERISQSDEGFPNRVLKIEGREYTLKADYILEIIDLSQDKDFLLQECYKARAAEYGSLEFQLDYIYHNGLDAWKAHIEQVKLNNPKPI